MTNDELLSKTINYLRFPLTVGVVFIHFNLGKGLSIHGINHGLENPSWYFFIINLISETVACIGVPLFFVFSGFLFFYRKEFSRNLYKQKLLSRVNTLFVPFILWNIIAIFYQLKSLLPGLSTFYRPVEVEISLERIFNTFFCNSNAGIIIGPQQENSGGIFPIDIPLWYVRDLMIMVILSPVIHWLIKRTDKFVVVILGIIWFSVPLIQPNGIYVDNLVTAFFFFLCGAFFSINRENFVFYFRRFKHAPFMYVCIATADALTKGFEFNGYIHKVCILIGVISAVIIVSYLLEYDKIKVNNILADSCFFIFALHHIFIGDFGRLVFTILRVPENNPYAMLTLYFAIPIFTVIVCISLYSFLKKHTPNFCRILTGGR